MGNMELQACILSRNLKRNQFGIRFTRQTHHALAIQRQSQADLMLCNAGTGHTQERTRMMLPC